MGAQSHDIAGDEPRIDLGIGKLVGIAVPLAIREGLVVLEQRSFACARLRPVFKAARCRRG